MSAINRVLQAMALSNTISKTKHYTDWNVIDDSVRSDLMKQARILEQHLGNLMLSELFGDGVSAGCEVIAVSADGKIKQEFIIIDARCDAIGNPIYVNAQHDEGYSTTHIVAFDKFGLPSLLLFPKSAAIRDEFVDADAEFDLEAAQALAKSVLADRRVENKWDLYKVGLALKRACAEIERLRGATTEE